MKNIPFPQPCLQDTVKKQNQNRGPAGFPGVCGLYICSGGHTERSLSSWWHLSLLNCPALCSIEGIQGCLVRRCAHEAGLCAGDRNDASRGSLLSGTPAACSVWARCSWVLLVSRARVPSGLWVFLPRPSPCEEDPPRQPRFPAELGHWFPALPAVNTTPAFERTRARSHGEEAAWLRSDRIFQHTLETSLRGPQSGSGHFSGSQRASALLWRLLALDPTQRASRWLSKASKSSPVGNAVYISLGVSARAEPLSSDHGAGPSHTAASLAAPGK